MANLSEKAIKEFTEIYFEEFQIKLSEDEAQRIASDFLRTFALVYRPLEGNNEKEKTSLARDTKVMEKRQANRQVGLHEKEPDIGSDTKGKMG